MGTPHRFCKFYAKHVLQWHDPSSHPTRSMPKRGAAAALSRRSDHADLADAKVSRRAAPLAVVISSLSTDDKIATARGILKELQHATVLVSDSETGRLATPDHGAFEVKEYTTSVPQLPPDAHHVVVVAHDLAQPSQIAMAMASDGRQAQLVAVVDSRTFLDDLDQNAKVEAAKKDDRAHLAGLSVPEVLAEFVETAAVVVLSHTEHANADLLEIQEGVLRELNPSVTVVRRGAGRLPALVGVVRASPERPAPMERSGCFQAVMEARRRGGHEDEGVEEEEEGDADEDGDEDEAKDAEDMDAEDEVEEDEDEGKEDEDPNVGEEEEGEEGWDFPELCRFTFFARRPFHPGRLHKLLTRDGSLEGVLRSKGTVWIASCPEDALLWSQVRAALASTRSAPRDVRATQTTPTLTLSGSAGLQSHCPPADRATPTHFSRRWGL